MKLSKKTHYALRALAKLAIHVGEGPVQSGELARSESIPAKFLEQILLVLTNAEILTSRRGVGGGYSLHRPADQVTLGEVIRLIEGPLLPFSCEDEKTPGCCSWADEDQCGLRAVMCGVAADVARIVDGVTLADMRDRTESLQQQKGSGLFHLGPAPRQGGA